MDNDNHSSSTGFSTHDGQVDQIREAVEAGYAAQEKELCSYGGCYFRAFAAAYDPYHQPIALSVCAFGFITNNLNIIVLTRPHMRTSTNTLLTSLSMAQLALVTNYIFLTLLQFSRRSCIEWAWGMSGTVYMYVNVNINVWFHTVAFAHTLCLAVFRIFGVKWPMRAQHLLKVRSAISWSVYLTLGSAVLCSAVFFSSHVEDFTNKHWHNCSLPNGKNFPQYDLSWRDEDWVLTGIFWVFGIGLKIIPCMIISIVTFGLIHSLRKAESRSARLLKPQRMAQTLAYASIPHFATSHMFKSRIKPLLKHRRTVKVRTRITRLLVTLVLLCISVELPHGILNLLNAIYGKEFQVNVYDNVGQFFELLTLLYSSINFVLCCGMSRNFRKTFTDTYSMRKGVARIGRNVSSGLHYSVNLIEEKFNTQ